MKTSKIIFFSLLGTIALLILAAFIDVRLTGHKDSGVIDRIDATDIPVSDFSVIVVKNCQGLNVIAESSPAISVQPFEKTKPAEIKYSVRNDTLFISDVEQYSESRNIKFLTVKTNGSIKSVLAENSHVRITRPGSDEFRIDADNSNIFMSGGVSGSSHLRTLSIKAKNQSDITSNDFTADSLLVSLHGSKASLMIKAESLQGKISSGSNLAVSQPNGISLKTDLTSQLWITHFER